MPQGIAHVRYYKEDDFKKAILALDGTKIIISDDKHGKEERIIDA